MIGKGSTSSKMTGTKEAIQIQSPALERSDFAVTNEDLGAPDSANLSVLVGSSLMFPAPAI